MDYEGRNWKQGSHHKAVVSKSPTREKGGLGEDSGERRGCIPKIFRR